MKNRLLAKLKKRITLFAFLSLICASLIQRAIPDQDLLHGLRGVLPGAETFEKVSSAPDIYEGF